MKTLAIKDLAEQTGLAAGTIRMWEQRYGFPEPERTRSGYRRYSPAAVQALQRVVELRESGLSMPAAIARVRDDRELVTDRPSIYAALASGPRQRLRKSTLVAMSRAIEDEALARAAAPMVFAAFQRERFYRQVQRRYVEMARLADAVTVFADFAEARRPRDAPAEVPIAPGAALANEWALIVDAPGYAACLVAWEPPDDQPDAAPDAQRRFETLWTVDPRVTRDAALVAARLAGRADAAVGQRLDALLGDRPLAMQRPEPALTALGNRMVAYLEARG